VTALLCTFEELISQQFSKTSPITSNEMFSMILTSFLSDNSIVDYVHEVYIFEFRLFLLSFSFFNFIFSQFDNLDFSSSPTLTSSYVSEVA